MTFDPTQAAQGDKTVVRGRRYINPDHLLKAYGNREWRAANHEARALIGREPATDLTGEPIAFKPIEGVEKAYDFVVERYADYVLLLNMLTSAMKRLLHPQKRLMFKRFIEVVACRVCELKNEMIKLSSTNIHNLVGCCAGLGVTPDQLEYTIPDSLVQDLHATSRERERALSLMVKTLESKPDCTLLELVALAHSKGSIANVSEQRISILSTGGPRGKGSIDSNMMYTSRERYDSKEFRDSRSTKKSSSSQSMMKSRSLLSNMELVSSQAVGSMTRRRAGGSLRSSIGASGTANNPVAKTEFNRNTSLRLPLSVEEFISSRRYKEMLVDERFHKNVRLLIGRWRMWSSRNDFRTDSQRLEAFFNMTIPEGTSNTGSDELKTAAEQTLSEAREDEYLAGLEALREQYITGSEGSFDIWALKLNIQQWILELRDLLGKIPPYPDEEAEGCLALFTDKTVAQVEEEINDLEDEKPTKKGGKEEKDKDKKKNEEKDKKKKETEKPKEKRDKDEGFLWTMPRSASLPEMARALDTYVNYWNYKLEMDDLEQRMDLQIAKETVRADAEGTIRRLVDAMMVAELDRMRAIDRERPPKPDKKGKGKKKDQGAKKRGKKKDPLADMSVEELYSELVLSDIVTIPRRVTMEDYIGAPNLVDTRRATYRPATSQDLKMALREMFGLPLCSRFIHSSVELRNSVLLAGPPGVGKTLLVNGLCRETSANLLDLSPARMVGKYQGKKREDYLMNLIVKVSSMLEPSIILVEECHLLFPTKKARKRPDVDRDKPARWARMLSRLMKKFREGDRMLLVGVTSEPFSAKTGAMCKLFKNVFLVPFPEYGSRLALWQNQMGKLKLTRPHDVNLSIMAKLTEGYTGSDIKAIVAKVCTASRQHSKRRLRNQEMLSALVSKAPDDEAPSLEDWVTWYLTTPMMRARQELIDGILEEAESAAAGGAASKAGKKK